MKVLVADDDPVSQCLLVSQLNRWGYETATESDGHAAQQALEDSTSRPSIALLDWMMPGIDGPALCRLLRSRAAEPYIYCILLTGRNLREDRLVGLEAGADDYLTKPVDLAELAVRLHGARRVVELEGRLIAARERLRAQANHDALTGLLNRVGLAEAMQREGARAQRHLQPCAAIMADVDHFKRINDTLGHLAGDRVLRRVARALRGVVRPYDAVARYGGEEFVAFLPDCSMEQAASVAERMRLAVAAAGEAGSDWRRALPPVTCSFGAAGDVLRPGCEPNDLVARADRALYAAKAAGRNRVVFERDIVRHAQPAGAAARATAPAPARSLPISRDRAEAIIDAIPVAIWAAAADGSTDYVNRHWSEYVGVTPRDLLGWKWEAITHPDDLGEVSAHWQRCVASRTPFERQVRYRHAASGEFRHNLARGTPLLDGSGNVVRWFGTLTDIHDRVLGEEREHALASRLRAVLRNTPVIMWSVDEDGRVLEIEGSKMADLPDACRPVAGESIAAMPAFSLADQDRLRRAQRGEASNFEIFCGARSFETFYAPIAGPPGRNAAVVAVMIETTARKDRERLTEQVRSSLGVARQKSAFLARISHEIRTPMNGVLGMVDMLLDTGLNAEQRRFAGTIQACGKHMVEIINDVLDLSKIEAGKLVMASRDFDIAAVVEAQVQIFVAQALQKGLMLSTFVDPNLPALVRGDPGRLAQVLLNLIGNAVKFTSRGNVVVRAVLGEASSPADVAVHFSVTDTGPGIPRDAQEAIFSAYRQEEVAVDVERASTGLGLAISRHLIAAMGGHIGVTSQIGEGSTFSFVVRLRASGSAEPAEADAARLAGVRVLVVEDDPISASTLQAYLQAWGADVHLATTGAEACEQASAAQAAGRPLDIAILDRKLPDQDGYILRTQLASRYQTPRRFSILSTAWERSGEATSALRSGFRGYLPKPFRRSELLACLLGPRSPTALPDDSAPQIPTSIGTQLASCRVLVAEDNRVNQVVITAALKRLGIAAKLVANGAEALDMLAHEAVDIVLMDCQMPQMDGIEATRRWRMRERGRGGRLPIIALTASALPEDVEACHVAGMDDFLAKPIEPTRLAMTLKKWYPPASP